MTNGEKLVKTFPDIELYKKTHGGIQIDFDSTWWNAEYKEPTPPNDCETCIHNKGVLECDMYGCKYEPTTKNDLGVDAVSRQEVLDLIADYDLSMGQVVRGIHALPSVTPQEPILDKIRAEIENDWQLKKYPSSPFSCGLRRAIEIIDKYKAETEVEDGNDN